MTNEYHVMEFLAFLPCWDEKLMRSWSGMTTVFWLQSSVLLSCMRQLCSLCAIIERCFHIAFCHTMPPSCIAQPSNIGRPYIILPSKRVSKQIINLLGWGYNPRGARTVTRTTPYLAYLNSQSLHIEQLIITVYFFWCTGMSSDLQSSLELLQMNNYVSGMVVHAFGMTSLMNQLECSCCCHCCLIWLWWMILCAQSYQNPLITATHHQSSPFQVRYIILLFTSCTICWLTTLQGILYLGKEATIVKQGPSSPQYHSTEPGPGSPHCLSWYAYRPSHHHMCSELTLL